MKNSMHIRWMIYPMTGEIIFKRIRGTSNEEVSVHLVGDLSNDREDKSLNEFVVHQMRNSVYIRWVIYPMTGGGGINFQTNLLYIK